MKQIALISLSLAFLASCTGTDYGERISSIERQLTEARRQNIMLRSENDALRQSQARGMKIYCKDETGGTPVITSLSAISGDTDTRLTIDGCNFAGFEGDLIAWIENEQGVKGILYSESGSTDKQLKVNLKPSLCQMDNSYSGEPCRSYLTLTPGKYKIYVSPWGKISNMIEFTIISKDNG